MIPGLSVLLQFPEQIATISHLQTCIVCNAFTICIGCPGSPGFWPLCTAPDVRADSFSGRSTVCVPSTLRVVHAESRITERMQYYGAGMDNLRSLALSLGFWRSNSFCAHGLDDVHALQVHFEHYKRNLACTCKASPLAAC